ncbi:unnamed protein product [Fusarium venenatum]|uniref:Uncharacterized protein n=1 Tax=Fusarium venenatum TaxID=56646 RepID=A0A2L2T4H7_9HYPO|nr:uncharacterized protein FVRRES_02196 [Fusarium venenatum]CEI65684.1 unnamed protein product [Fusarium venenatum]
MSRVASSLNEHVSGVEDLVSLNEPTADLRKLGDRVQRVTGVDEDFLKVEKGEEGEEDSERGDSFVKG